MCERDSSEQQPNRQDVCDLTRSYSEREPMAPKTINQAPLPQLEVTTVPDQASCSATNVTPQLPKIILTNTDRLTRHSCPGQVHTEDANQMSLQWSPKNCETETTYLLNKYNELSGSILIVEISISPSHLECAPKEVAPPLGLRLIGNRNLNQMSVFICSVRPGSPVDLDGRIEPGDQILEINRHVLYGMSHLNAAPIIRAAYLDVVRKAANRSSLGLDRAKLRLVLHRYPMNLASMAVPTLSTADASQKSSRRSSAETRSQLGFGSGGPVEDEGNAEDTVAERLLDVTLVRAPMGFGFTVRSLTNSHNDHDGVYVSELITGGPACVNKQISVGDRLVSINQTNVLQASPGQVDALIGSVAHELHLKVSRRYSAGLQSVQSDIQPPITRSLSATLFRRLLLTRHNSSSPDETTSYENHKEAPHPKPPRRWSSLSHLWYSAGSKRPSKASSISEQTERMFHTSVRSQPVGSRLSDPRTKLRTIPVGKETEIELPVTDNGLLGIGFIGGSETSQNHILIHQIYENGAAAVDGRLRPGDIVLSMEGKLLRGTPFLDALRHIHTAFHAGVQRASYNQLDTARPAATVRLKVYRPDTAKYQWYDEQVEVELTKKSGRGLGICLRDRFVRSRGLHDGSVAGNGSVGLIDSTTTTTTVASVRHAESHGVIITEVIKGTVAGIDGRLMSNDQILLVNGIDTSQATSEFVGSLIKSASNKVVLKVARLKNQVNSSFICGYTTSD